MQVVYYDEMLFPVGLRIVSEKLCLDHTVLPGSCMGESIGLKELQCLQKSPLVDKLMVCFRERMLFRLETDGGRKEAFDIVGWQDVRGFDFHPLRELYEAYCKPWDRDSLIWHSSEGQEYL